MNSESRVNPERYSIIQNSLEDKVTRDFSVIQLAQESTASLDPVLHGLVCGQQYGQHKVGGVTSCGQDAPTLAGLVDGWAVAFVRFIDFVLLLGLQPDDGNALIEDLGLLLRQAAPGAQRTTVLEDTQGAVACLSLVSARKARLHPKPLNHKTAR